MLQRERRSAASLVVFAVAALAAAQTAEPGALAELARDLDLENARQQAQVRLWAQSFGYRTEWTTSGGNWVRLARIENGMPVYIGSESLEQAITTNVRPLWPGQPNSLGLTGTGVIMGLWDGRPQTSHPEFGGRVTLLDGGTAGDRHGTHVAGIMLAAGVDAAARGMASSAQIRWRDTSNDLAEMAAAAGTGMRQSNHSYGPFAGWREDFFGDGRWAWFGNTSLSTNEDATFGYYGSESRQWDQVVVNAPLYQPVVSAGNNRFVGPASAVDHWVRNPSNGNWVRVTSSRPRNGGTQGYDTLNTAGKTAKNVLVVANALAIPGGYQTPGQVVLNGSSNAGPTDDGRLKPDITAVGTDVRSAVPTSTYANLSGTSMAAPNVTGTLALLTQLWRRYNGTDMRNTTQRAVLIASAREAGPALGPDYRYGWGLMDGEGAAEIIAADQFDGTVVSEGFILAGQTLSFAFQRTPNVTMRATLVWNDPPATVRPLALDDPNRRLVNDLNLRVITSTSTLFPWVLNPAVPSAPATVGNNIRDNVEQVLFASGTGTATVRISAPNPLFGSPQFYSLVVTGATPASRLTGVSIVPSSVVGGSAAAVNAVATVSSARVVDRYIRVRSSNPAFALGPAMAKFDRNVLVDTIPILHAPVDVPTPIELTFTASSTVLRRTLTLVPATLVNVSGPATVRGGSRAIGTVELNGRPATDRTISLTSSNPLVLTVPPSVVVPRTVRTANFGITTRSVRAATNVTITATNRGTTKTFVVRVTP